MATPNTELSTKTGPSRGWYALAGIVLLVGVVGGIVIIVTSIVQMFNMDDGFERVVVPAGGEVTLAEPGDFTIFYEHESTFNNKRYSTPVAQPAMTITVGEIAAPERAIAVKPMSGSMSYNMPSRSGYAIGWFHAPQPGVYRIDASYSSPNEPERVLAIGQGFLGDIFRSMLGMMIGIGSLVLSFAAALVIWLVTFLSRRKAGPQPSDVTATA